MFYGRDNCSGASGVSGRSISVYDAGARRGRGIPSAYEGGIAAQNRSNRRDHAGNGAAMSALRTVDAPQGYAIGLVASSFWTFPGAGYPLPLRFLPRPAPAAAGCAGRGTGTHQWFPGAIVGAAGSGGTVSIGGASSAGVAGSNRESDGRLAGGATAGTSGSQLQRGLECVSCR